MLFNSIHYLVFFPIVVALYFVLPTRHRALFLVLASCYFYMAFKPAYILILFVVIAIDYFSGLYIERHTGWHRRLGLVASIASNIGILFVFKYFNLYASNVSAASALLGLSLEISIHIDLHLSDY